MQFAQANQGRHFPIKLSVCLEETFMTRKLSKKAESGVSDKPVQSGAMCLCYKVQINLFHTEDILKWPGISFQLFILNACKVFT